MRAWKQMMRALSRMVATVAIGVWLAAGLLPWLLELRADHAGLGPAAAEGELSCAWQEAAARSTARHLLLEGFTSELSRAEALLACSVAGRPLYAPSWLARAEAAHRRGDLVRADAYLDLATALWPNRPRLIWNAAVLRTEMGDDAGAFALLAHYLRVVGPDGTTRVLHLAEQLDRDADSRVEALLGKDALAASEREEILRRVLHVALHRRDASLARAGWSALSEEGRLRRELIDLYVETRLAVGDIDRAVGVWRAYGRPGHEPAAVTNGGFESEPSQRGFGWRLASVAGAGWSRDAGVRHGGAHSLRIRFAAQEDLWFGHASQRVAVRQGRRYRVTGFWRGADVTTASGPYLEAAPVGEGPLAVTPSRTGSWEWEPFRLEFLAPGDAPILEFRMRRNPEGLGRGFAGTVWLDDIAVHEVPAGPSRG